jgi:hypothetical protein
MRLLDDAAIDRVYVDLVCPLLFEDPSASATPELMLLGDHLACFLQLFPVGAHVRASSVLAVASLALPGLTKHEAINVGHDRNELTDMAKQA